MKRNALSVLSVAVSLALTSATASAAVIGFLGNFDVINDTGKTAYGFEIDLEGLHKTDISDVFGGPGRGFPSGRGFGAGSVERYGAPSIIEYSSGATFGTKVTYFATFAAGSWDYTTPSTQAVGHFATPGDNCWSGGGVGYGANTPCDHFGVGTRANATKTSYSWLYGDSAGNLTNAGGAVSLPAPVWAVIPPAPGLPPAPPIVAAQIQAPALVQPSEKPEPQWGEAIWVKVFTTELEKPVGLEELVGGNPKVALAQTETEWQLLQTDPDNPLSGQLESGYGAPVGPKAASILRRYEFYKFGGTYDETDHHAIFLNPLSTDSLAVGADIGNYIGAQNGAANFNVAAIPEPDTYAMMLAGLGLVITIACRRNNPRPL